MKKSADIELVPRIRLEVRVSVARQRTSIRYQCSRAFASAECKPVPLQPGSSRAIISNNIREMRAAGYPQDQSVAAALSNARRHPRAFSGGGLGTAIADGLGSHDRFQSGGEFSGLSAQTPWWTRAEARKIFDQPSGGGLITSSGAGRTDQVPLAVGTDSHILPADVVSGLGQGNTLAGARILNAALRIGPYGTSLPQHFRGPGPPHAPSMSGHGMGFAEGGSDSGRPEANGSEKHDTSVLVAGGEAHIPRENWLAPDEDGHLWEHAGVRSIGEGDLEKGHARLNDLIHRVRAHAVEFLKHAPPPKE